ncbi:hypothetical protein GP2143_09540 [marine gamma proteobacterium HTCC2143]|jgi:uncharacterized protein YaiL (DUF2058 family)|uniref:Nucleoprotein/polynucleotide-associated enzyme n=1 Tax=marine gamma proteobacterium HTCC2143 TaxID=247633 RepID=A0YFM4_9GAMM|nr:hypothetical protein GP2143_09540 [marine gamma proteobacterium HTCC2143]
MAGSLQDQLLNAGLADAKKAKKIKKDKQKQAKVSRRDKSETVDETKQQLTQSRKEKLDRDRKLNSSKNAEAERKAIAAQVKQLITVNSIARNTAELNYNFTDNKKIKKILVDKIMLDQLSGGRLAIVSLDQSYHVVAAAVAEKIKQRIPECVIVANDTMPTESDEEDPYADFQIPDDLMW